VRLSIPWIRGLVIAASMLPMLRLVLWPALDRAGANPVEFVTRSSGTWTLVFLLLALSVSPLRRLTGAGWLMRLRRPLGLASFAYALAHLATWVWLEHWFEIAPMISDVLKRPFITAGFAALVLLIPLALTSTDAMVRRLGRRWSTLHQLV
jgi:sulfoxide reductase heme-binding subunit YedZ